MAERIDISELSLTNAINASLAGDHNRAVWAMRWLLQYDAATYTRFFSKHASVEVRLDFLRAQASNEDRNREIVRECPLLGRAGAKLEPVQRKLIEQLLVNRWDSWTAGAMPHPRRADIFANAADLSQEKMKAIKVAVVFTKHIHCNPEYVESDFYHHFYQSARAAGLNAVRFAADRIFYDPDTLPQVPRPTRPIEAELSEFTAFLENEMPDLVVFEGNPQPTENTLQPRYWMEQKQRLGFKLLTVIGDCYDHSLSSTPPWLDCSDAYLSFHPDSLQITHANNPILSPSMPFAEASFQPSISKDLGLVSLGTATRNRYTWLAPLSESGVPVYVTLHDRTIKSAHGREEYSSLMGRSKLTFNNGYVNKNANILTGRFFEGLLSKSLALQEIGSPVDAYFHPFIHYVPVANVDQLISFARFFLEAEDWRGRIVDAALDYWRDRYASTKMWRSICARLFNEG